MPPIRTQVFGLACSPFWQIWFFQTIASSLCSQWRTTTSCSPCFWTFSHNHRYYNLLQGGMDVVPSFLRACDVLLGTPGALWDLFSPGKGTGSSNSTISKNFWITTTSFVSKKYMEKTSFFNLSRSWVRDFGSLVHFFQIMKMREDRLLAFIGTFYLKRLLWHIR